MLKGKVVLVTGACGTVGSELVQQLLESDSQIAGLIALDNNESELYTADTLVKMGLLTVSSWDDVHIMLLLPIVWWITAIWRCSANAQFKAYMAGARLVTFAVLFEYALKLLLRIDYPRLFFGCEELLLDYGSCF